MIGEKEEGLVLDQRPAKRSAVLILFQLRPRLPLVLEKVVVGVERVVAEKLEDAAMQFVGTGFCHQNHVAAGVAPLRGIVKRGLHDELLDRVNRRRGNIRRRVGADGVDLDAIDEHVVACGLLAVHVDVHIAPAQRDVVGQRDARARLEAKQLLVVARGQRQLMHFPLFHHAPGGCGFRLHRRRLGRHLHIGGCPAHLQLRRNIRGLCHAHLDAPGGVRGKTLRGHMQRILARLNPRKAIVALAGGLRLARLSGCRGQHNPGAHHCRAGRIMHRACNLPRCCRLRRYVRCQRQQAAETNSYKAESHVSPQLEVARLARFLF